MVSEPAASNTAKKVLTGTVVSDKMQKTIVVEVERTYRHPVFGKTVRARRKFKVHDENGQAGLGDIVSFYEGRPVSKTKYLYLKEIVRKAVK